MLRTSASSRRDRSDIDIVLRLASRAPCPRDPRSSLWETQPRLQRITAALTDSRSDADDRTLSTSRLLCLLLWRLRADDAREVDAERGSSTSGEAAGATCQATGISALGFARKEREQARSGFFAAAELSFRADRAETQTQRLQVVSCILHPCHRVGFAHLRPSVIVLLIAGSLIAILTHRTRRDAGSVDLARTHTPCAAIDTLPLRQNYRMLCPGSWPPWQFDGQ